ncbi:queuine tRNA-ribosyltransferase accessory subunit 2-like [Oscarella lobularis]|uniref:queuine tRNA-ribosyltransferase accessory subunit 2-like n=1 Tax=Oscarella lobularis TaxID=121494 RepID=UPI0033140FA9
MQCAFSAGLRVGHVVVHGGTRLSTPGCLIYTRCGAVPHLVHDLWKEDEHVSPFVQMSLSSTYEHPGLDVVKAYGKGINAFSSLNDFTSFCFVQDPIQPQKIGYNEEKTVSIWTVSGRQKLTILGHLDVIEAFRPDWFQALCDTVHDSSISLKRVQKSVNRTLRYLDETLIEQQKRKPLETCTVFGSVEGAGTLSERLRSASETAKRPVGGFILEGFNFDNSFEGQLDILGQTVACLPAEKPRILPGPISIECILDCVERGVDIFDSSYAYQLTEKGIALNLYPQNEQNSESREKKLLDLTDRQYSDNMTLLFEGYSLAYIHHLLTVKEMLGSVILMRHNLRQYLKFFHNLRRAIQNDDYQRFRLNLINT